MDKNDTKIHWWFISATLSVAVVLVTALAISSYNTDVVIADQTTHMQKVQVAVGPQVPSGKVAGVEVVRAKVIIQRSITGNTVSVDMNLEAGSTVFDALQDAVVAYGLPLDTKDYGDLGVLVNSIGDLVGGQDGKYWSYYVNGEPATIAVNQQVVQPGDTIEFKFAESLF
ncbi:MAG: DUF4430 domain-containing protein [Patescibacteria group bacterium]